MKVDDWVQIQGSGEIGVVVDIGELVVVRVPRKDSPFPKYIGTEEKNLKRYRPPAEEVQHERATL
jgi:hypothetical protein